jgi:hypothetical protein
MARGKEKHNRGLLLMTVSIPKEYSGFDFGFTGVDEPIVDRQPETVVDPTIHERFDALERTMQAMMENMASTTISSGTESELKDKIRQLEAIIVPLLNNLLKTADKDYIYWPKRKEVIEKQLEHVLSITRG